MTVPFSRLGANQRAPDVRLPPGQYARRSWPALHYGKVPPFDESRWRLEVFGRTADGTPSSWDWPAFGRLARTEVAADLHCVTRFSLLDSTWTGVPAASLLELAPPAPSVTHVMVWAEYGYSANLTVDDFRSAILATHRDGEPLAPEHGFPVRLVVPHRYAWKGPKWVRGVEYMDGDRRGFWEERGYHNRADVWQEQRYSYQELPADP